MKRGIILPLVLAIVAVAIAIGGLFFFKSRSSTQPSTQSPQEEVTTSPETTDETANWKTYTNSAFGYSFKYPSEWEFLDKTDYSNKIFAPKVGEGGLVVYEQSHPKRDFNKYGVKIINGNKVYVYTKPDDLGSYYIQIYVFVSPDNSKYVYFNTPGFESERLPKEQEKINDQVLSTFRFE